MQRTVKFCFNLVMWGIFLSSLAVIAGRLW